MFMEYCNEGTLWSIAQQGLTEQMIRHYTKDLLKAVFVLHDRGIVHRDIKGEERGEERRNKSGSEGGREGGRGKMRRRRRGGGKEGGGERVEEEERDRR